MPYAPKEAMRIKSKKGKGEEFEFPLHTMTTHYRRIVKMSFMRPGKNFCLHTFARISRSWIKSLNS